MRVDIDKRIEEKFNNKLVNTFPSKNLLIEVTNICNNKCIFCANRRMTRSKGQIDYALAVRVLKECYDLGSREVGFYATGEPLLYDRLSDLIVEAKKIGYEYIYITTNGLLATKERIKALLDVGLQSIKFSINAINREDYIFVHGVDAFDIVMRNLKDCRDLQKKYKNKLFVSTILTKYTDYDRTDIEKCFEGLCDRVVVQNAKNQGGLLPTLNDSLLITKSDGEVEHFNIPCSYVFNSVTVTYEGYLTGCCMDFQNYLAYADLNKVSVSEGWNNSVITNMRNLQSSGEVGNTLCKSCVYGKCDKIEPLCEDFATRVEDNFFIEDIDMNERIKSKIENKIKGE
ncbi:MAG: radical SAM protein [Clostridiales bacterium]|nr:radical SAM protein [Clostridiales bacterium]